MDKRIAVLGSSGGNLFLLSMLIALGSAFVFTTLANKPARKKQTAA